MNVDKNKTKTNKPRRVYAIFKVLIAGSHSNNGVNAGAFILNSNNDSANRNTNYGRQLNLSRRTFFNICYIRLASWQNISAFPKVLVAKAKALGKISKYGTMS